MRSSATLSQSWTTLPEAERLALARRATWLQRARRNQITPDGAWTTWLILAGRGWGKTRSGAEDVAWYGVKHPGSRIAIVAPTYADGRDTCVEGESGLLAVLPRSFVAAWNRSLGELLLGNGSRYKLFSGEEPERLRGPQHHRAWCDEVAAWRYPETWDQLQFGLRLGERPQVVVTTTPKPVALVRSLVAAPTTIVTRGATFENEANLAPSALASLRDRYQGTRLGRQELEGEILEDVPGALWTRAELDSHRVREAPEMSRVVVAVDPPVSSGEEADECGIVVVGKGRDGHGYVLADATSQGESPSGWAERAVRAYRVHSADRIVAEANQGGEMVREVIRHVDDSVPVTIVHATRGKVTRAEPVSALYEQGRMHHVGSLSKLEDQMCLFTTDFDPKTAGFSPDRVDALVWAVTDLLLGARKGAPRIMGL